MTASLLSPLKDRTYRHLFSAQVIALIGTGLTTVALALLAFEIGGESAGQILGTALALKMVAYVVIAPIVGAYADRLPRRALLVSLDVGRMALVALLPFVTEVWQIYALILAINACSAGFTPVFQATIPDILPDENQYTRALSLSRLAYDLENLLSPMAAAALLTLLSFDALFGLNSVAFAVSALLVLSVRLPGAKEAADKTVGVIANITSGIRRYLSVPRLRGLLALSFGVSAAGAMVIVNTVVYVKGALHLTDEEVAVTFAAYGAGSMIVALALPRLLDDRPDRPFMMAGGFLSAVGLLIGLVLPGFFGLLGLWFILGCGASLIQTPAGRLLRRSSDEGDRSALFSAQFALSHGCWLICYPLAGWLGKASLELVFGVMGGLVAVSTLGAMLVWEKKSVSNDG